MNFFYKINNENEYTLFEIQTTDDETQATKSFENVTNFEFYIAPSYHWDYGQTPQSEYPYPPVYKFNDDAMTPFSVSAPGGASNAVIKTISQNSTILIKASLSD